MRILAGFCLIAALGTGLALHGQAPSMTKDMEAPPPPPSRVIVQAPPPNSSGTRTASGAVRISGGVMAGQLVKRVMPACSTGAVPQGIVVMHAIIGTDGKVQQLTLLSGPPDAGYTASVMSAVRQWEYKPYLLHGEPVKVDTTITFDGRTLNC